jgi:chromosome segregation ATPase
MALVKDLLQAIRKIVLLEELLNQLVASQDAMKEDIRVLTRDLNTLAREVAELRGKYQDVETRVIDQLELRFLRAQARSPRPRKRPDK